MKTKLWLGTTLCLLLLALIAPAVGAQRSADMTFVPFPEGTGRWIFSALECGPDGKIYVGTCNLFAGAHLLRYDPETGEMEVLGDMQDVTNEHDPELIPQSKIHTQLVFTKDWKLYFGTNSEERYWADFNQFPKGYTGGYLLFYDLKTGEFTNLGIPIPQKAEPPVTNREDYGESLITMAIDPERELVYILTWPKAYFLVHDIKTGETTNKGSIGRFQTRDMEVARDGKVYTVNADGQVVRYDPERDCLEVLPVNIPDFPRGDPRREGVNVPYSLAINKNRTRIYGSSSRTGHLFELVCFPGRKVRVRDLGLCVPEELDGQRTSIGIVHAATMGKDGKVYYAITDTDIEHLFCYDPHTRQIENLGTVRFTNRPNQRLGAAWAACTGADGAIYIGGITAPEENGGGIMIYHP